MKQGTIAWAILQMPNGQSKRRPVVIATPDNLIRSDAMIRVVGISGSYRPDDPDAIPIPWRPDGNIFTGLSRPSAISLALTDEMMFSALEPTDKWIGKPALIELLERLKQVGDR